MEGKILGNRYELVEKIGGGGMALVYKAKCTLLNRYVAIKILRHEFTNDEEFVKRFRVEAQAAASLSHPNIVSIYDVGCEGDVHYIVMEYVKGVTLKEYLEEHKILQWKDAVNIAIQICSAIEHAHANHVVHRDIKPHNILFTNEGVAKVTDFGIARAVSSSTITMAGNTIGSVHYFSPEQARGGFTDEKSDLYSLGIVLYELVTGKLPFNGDTPVAVAIKHIQEQPQEPIEIIEDLPKGVNSIIMGAIQKDQTNRYQTATEMLSQLYKVLKNPNIDFTKQDDIYDSPTVRIPTVGDSGLILDKKSIEKSGDDKVSKKKDKLMVVMAYVISAILLVVLGVATSKIFSSMNKAPEDFLVENYVGKEYSEIEKMLKENQIDVKIEREPNDDYSKDIIFKQSQSPGMKLKPGTNEYSSIILYVSSGTELVEIPYLENLNYIIAKQKLEDLNLEVQDIVEEFSDTVMVNSVVRTEPSDGTEVSVGSGVTIYKSKGPELKTTIVPSIIGKTKAEATNLLLNHKLKVGSIYPRDMENAVDRVVRQVPEPGEEVNEDTPVSFYLEVQAPDPTPTPENTPVPTETPPSTENGDDNGGNGDIEVTEKIVQKTIELMNPDSFREDIFVTVKITRTDTNESSNLVSQSYKKSDFPIRIDVPVYKGSTSIVAVFLDEKPYMDFAENF